MRKVAEIKYETTVESDVSELNIYAFHDGKDVSILSRKGDMFYWQDLRSVNHVWYEEYETIEEAIEGIMKVKEYKDCKCTPIMEFTSLSSFVRWVAAELEIHVNNN